MVVPKCPEVIRRRSGVFPQALGIVPQSAGGFPQLPGIVPKPAGEAPAGLGKVPQRPGEYPRRPGEAPQPSGVFPPRRADGGPALVGVLFMRGTVAEPPGAAYRLGDGFSIICGMMPGGQVTGDADNAGTASTAWRH